MASPDKTRLRILAFLQDAFSLLAYPDPWSSSMGWQLSAKEREGVSAALNSAILESRQLPGKPPLEVALAHTKELIKGRQSIHSDLRSHNISYFNFHCALNLQILQKKASYRLRESHSQSLKLTECLSQTMANNDLGASAFANVDEYFK